MTHVYIGFYFGPECALKVQEHFPDVDVTQRLIDDNGKVTSTLRRLTEKRGLSIDDAHAVNVRLIKYLPGQPSEIGFVPQAQPALQAAITQLQEGDRIVIAGHATDDRFMWGKAPDVLVRFFSGEMAPPHGCRLSLYCCHAGDLEEKEDGGWRMVGWAGKFHRDICALNDRTYTVSARTGSLRVSSKGVKIVTSRAPIDYHKVVIHRDGNPAMKKPVAGKHKINVIQPVQAPPVPQQPIVPAPAAAQAQAQVGDYCPHCEEDIGPDDAFCGSCGQRI